jgi:hypothetical protein
VSCVIGYIVHRAFFKIEKCILPEFVKESINGTKTVFFKHDERNKMCPSNLVIGTENVFQNWLVDHKMS